MPLLSANALGWLIESALSTQSLLLGRAVHAHIIRTIESPFPPFLSNHLINFYSKLDSPNTAQLLLSLTPPRFRSVVTWTALIAGSVQNGHFTSALLHFSDMRRQSVQPNDFTFPCLFKASAFLHYSLMGQQLHALALKGEEPPNSITFCVFLNACSDGLYLKLGQQLHGYVIRFGFGSDVSVLNGMVDFYGKCHQVKYSELVFNEINVRNGVSWCTMLAVYEQNDIWDNAFMLFLKARKEGIKPTEFMLSSVLSACAGMAVLELGRSIHGLAVKACIEHNVFVGSALVDMYGKCGSIDNCESSFYEMPERNLITWNAVMGGSAHQGCADMALSLFEEMTSESHNVVPSYVTFVCVLTACSRAGAVKIGMDIFESMQKKYGIEPGPEHYACVVDILGRAGLVERAYDFIKKMPVPPTVSVWGALLGACRVHGKPELGKVAADNLFRLDPLDSGNHVILSNMFAAAGRWDEANLVRKEMKDVGITKGAGVSWISAKNSIHIFQAKDTTHERYPEIQAMLAKLRRVMKAEGYIADTNSALYDLEEEEKESEVWHHSEKIALAFGLIAIPPGVPIRITKNLRVCVDCHSAIKFISGITGREIIVRDNNRFHSFKDYQCSCRDYW
ncbi:hypothetical protein H5410_005513 [Solanum commersonii]|uniref:DYW domain-containing protein n=1 Tax=Solanum commersonii TaxID=4109 RepID=A0A9J6A8G5_SOLCO|nr:hypothetical protein H5410_005513 [Solanum commersonii]